MALIKQYEVTFVGQALQEAAIGFCPNIRETRPSLVTVLKFSRPREVPSLTGLQMGVVKKKHCGKGHQGTWALVLALLLTC
jgi:hypothetical protein